MKILVIAIPVLFVLWTFLIALHVRRRIHREGQEFQGFKEYHGRLLQMGLERDLHNQNHNKRRHER